MAIPLVRSPLSRAVTLSALSFAGLAGCVGAGEDAPRPERLVPAAPRSPDGVELDLASEVERIRDATAAFRDLDEAVAAGYPRAVSRCIERPPEGGMGYHHQNPALLDARLEVERPEILVYEQTGTGEYELTGVEYVVPFRSWPDEPPPTILGRSLKPAPALQIWYLHVWVWRSNPSGLFADWNPTVACRPRQALGDDGSSTPGEPDATNHRVAVHEARDPSGVVAVEPREHPGQLEYIAVDRPEGDRP
jgi:hypothetical protein